MNSVQVALLTNTQGFEVDFTDFLFLYRKAKEGKRYSLCCCLHMTVSVWAFASQGGTGPPSVVRAGGVSPIVAAQSGAG